jgi:hypothetical protein
MRANRSLLLVTLVLGLVAVTVSAQDGSVTGNWTLTMTTPRGEQSSTLVLVQTGEKLAVTLKNDRGESTGSGTVKGAEIEWSITRQTPMGEMTMPYKGKVAGDTMTGEVTMMDRAITWKAVRDRGAAAPTAKETPAATPPAAAAKPKKLVTVDKVMPAPQNVKAGLESITGRELEANLKFLSSDALEGRETGTVGYRVAAEYAATMFSLWELSPAGDLPSRRPSRGMMMGPPPSMDEKPSRGYLQQIELKEVVETGGSAKAEWREGANYKAKAFERDIDYQYGDRGGASDSQVMSAPVVFVGYGISEKVIGYNDYAGLDTKGKIVMMLSGVPASEDPKSPFAKDEIKNKYDPPMFGRRPRFAPSERDKIAQANGAVAILMVESSPEKNGDVAKRVLDSGFVNDERAIIPGERRRVSLIDASSERAFQTLPTVRVSRQMADEILKLAGTNVEALKQLIAGDLKPHSMALKGVTFTVESQVKTKLLRSANVLGYVEGSDPKLKDEVVIIGAHLDHLGKRGEYLYNGADDNGSGSVAVLAIAQAFAANPVKPKRSVLFALWTGEEEGLLGSRNYVLHPYFPLAKTVVNLNLDMVSRKWDKSRLAMMSRMFGEELSEEELAAIDPGNLASFAFKDKSGKIRQAALDNNQYVGLAVLPNEAQDDGIGAGGSDHAPFAMKGVSWAFLSAGMTEDYHQPSDSIEKVSKELMEKITRLTYLTAFSLANGN